MNFFFKMMTIIISSIIILGCAYYNSIKQLKEGLTNKNAFVVLIGDSILNNSNYVFEGKSVPKLLEKKTTNILSLAKDGATISDCYSQLDKVPSALNTNDTSIFISAGGNNILNSKTQLDSQAINKLFDNLTEFIKAVKARLPGAKLNIVNLYIPSDPKFQSYKPIIDQWNQLIKSTSFKTGLIYTVTDVYSLLNNPTDFVYSIEPSETGGQKIADLIYVTL